MQAYRKLTKYCGGSRTGNVQKCLAAGFNEVILISSEKSLLTTVKQAAIAALTAQQYKLVKFLTPEQVFAYIESQEATAEGRPGGGRSERDHDGEGG